MCVYVVVVALFARETVCGGGWGTSCAVCWAGLAGFGGWALDGVVP